MTKEKQIERLLDIIDKLLEENSELRKRVGKYPYWWSSPTITLTDQKPINTNPTITWNNGPATCNEVAVNKEVV